MKIAVLCPSRGRPDLAKRMEKSFEDNSTSDVTVYFCLDSDDEYLEQYRVKHRWVIPRMPLSFKTNYLYDKVVGLRDWQGYMFCGDDGCMRTPDWQKSLEIRTCIHRDGIWAAGFYDGREWDSYPHFAVSAKWAGILGYVTPPYYYHWYVDSTTEKVAQAIGRWHKMDNVLVEHMTFKVKKREIDGLDKEIRAGLWHEHDTNMYNMSRYWKADVELLRSAVDG